jgi:hypothetical protein
MPLIAGENPVPLGRSGTGASFVLGSHEPSALAILMQGERTRALAAQRAAQAKQKQAEKIAKDFNDDLKYKTTTGRLFQPSFDEQAAGLVDKLTGIYKQRQQAGASGGLTEFEVKQQSRNLLNDAEKLRVHGEEKQKFWDTRAGLIAHDPTRNLTNYNNALAHSLIGPDGKRVLATDHNPEATATALDADPTTYNENEVVRKTLKDVVPVITQRISEAGTLGGQHYADQVKGQLLQLKDGHPVLNADHTPQLNLNGGTMELLDQGPVKVLADAREAAYNKRREAEPNLPVISRRGHLAMMFGPQVAYTQEHTEGLNGQVPRPRTTKANPHEVLATPTVTGQTSYYRAGGSRANTPNHYAAVGHSFGSTSKPFVEVEANNGAMEIVGQNGEVTHPNVANANGRVPMRLISRDYVLYANGKRLGRPEPFQTDEEAHQQVLKLIRESPHPEKLELRVMGRGVVVDKAKTAGDGLGGSPQPTGFNRKTGKPTYDTSTGETQYNVIVPITQDMDAQLKRATNGKWNPYQASAQENELIREVQKRGGRVITPYNNVQPLAPKPAKTPPTTRPAWLPTKAPAKASTPTSTLTPRNADTAGGMLD